MPKISIANEGGLGGGGNNGPALAVTIFWDPSVQTQTKCWKVKTKTVGQRDELKWEGRAQRGGRDSTLEIEKCTKS